MPKFTFKKVSNMVFCVSECDVIFYAWMAEEFTKRKMQNAIARIKAYYHEKVMFYFDGV